MPTRFLCQAEELGRAAAEAGWIVLTGGRSRGVMHAACTGAKVSVAHIVIGFHKTCLTLVQLCISSSTLASRFAVTVCYYVHFYSLFCFPSAWFSPN